MVMRLKEGSNNDAASASYSYNNVSVIKMTRAEGISARVIRVLGQLVGLVRIERADVAAGNAYPEAQSRSL